MEIFRILVEHWELGKVPACLFADYGGPVPLISWQNWVCFFFGREDQQIQVVSFFNNNKKLCFRW
jgi:hypothetical protein